MGLIKVNDFANFRKINSMIDGNAQNIHLCAEIRSSLPFSSETPLLAGVWGCEG